MYVPADHANVTPAISLVTGLISHARALPAIEIAPPISFAAGNKIPNTEPNAVATTVPTATKFATKSRADSGIRSRTNSIDVFIPLNTDVNIFSVGIARDAKPAN